MRLLRTTKLELADFPESNVPPYAILSHTWTDHEVNYRDMYRISRLRRHPGLPKIVAACQKAAADGHHYIWIDCCCIDKSSSAELSTAINSMFQWYRNSVVCYVLLSDFDLDMTTPSELAGFEQCRWHSRGWTLQELLASPHVEFYDPQWRELGTKLSLVEHLVRATRINKAVLRGTKSLASCTVAERMSWAAGRKTTRSEDIAYCLLGLFDVHMPLLYGEGRQRAFERLQEEITRRTDDVSLLLWMPHTVPGQDPGAVGSLAPCPDYFCRRSLCAECGTPIDYANLRMMRLSDREHLFSRMVDLPDHQMIRRDFGMIPLSGGRKLQLYCHLIHMPTGSAGKTTPVVLLNVVEDTDPPHLFAMHLKASVLVNMNAQFQILGFESIRLDALPLMKGSVATISIFRELQPSLPSLTVADVRLTLMSRELWGAQLVQKRAAANLSKIYGAVWIPIQSTSVGHLSLRLTMLFIVHPPNAASSYTCSMSGDWSDGDESPNERLYMALRAQDGAVMVESHVQAFERQANGPDRLTMQANGSCYTARMRPAAPLQQDDDFQAGDAIRRSYVLEIRRQEWPT